MAQIGELVWKITGDTSGLEKNVNKSNKSVDGLANKLSKSGDSMETAFKKIAKAAGIYGDKTAELSAQNVFLKNRMEQLILKGVDPTNKGFVKLKESAPL